MTRAADVMARDLLVAGPTVHPAAALEAMAGAGLGHLPVVVEGRCVAIVSEASLRAAGSAHRRLADWVGYPPLGVLPDDTLQHVAQTMWAGRVDAVVVADRTGRLTGLITTHDMLAALAGQPARHAQKTTLRMVTGGTMPSTDPVPDPMTLQDVVQLAIRAPSIHNSQPWRWRIGAARLDLYADEERRLPVVDPGGRALRVSCGAALYLARLGLRAAGWEADVARMPEPDDHAHLATLRVTGRGGVSAETQRLVDAAWRRRTDRRPFAEKAVDPETVDRLRVAAAAEGAMLRIVHSRDDRTELAVAVGRADEIESADPAYVAEMRRWTGRERSALEGVPAAAVPHLPGRQSEPTIRDFEVAAGGTLRAPDPGRVERATMLILATDEDTDTDQVRAGEALAHLLLVATELGLAVSPYTQPLEVAGPRMLLESLLGGIGHAQIVLRVGWPGPGGEPPLTARRPVEAVIEG